MLVRPTEKVGSTSSTIGKVSLEHRNQSFFGLVLKFVECVHGITSSILDPYWYFIPLSVL